METWSRFPAKSPVKASTRIWGALGITVSAYWSLRHALHSLLFDFLDSFSKVPTPPVGEIYDSEGSSILGIVKKRY